MSDYDRVMRVIDDATEPKRMSKEAAVDFLERMIDDLKMRIEAMREEMRE